MNGNKLFRVLRIVFAGGLIALSLWALLLPPLFPYSTHAIVNTKVVTIRAAGDGQITGLPPLRHKVLEAGAVVGRVTRDPVKIQRELAQKELHRDKLQERLTNLEREIGGMQSGLEQLRASAMRGLAQTQKAIEEKARISRDELREKKARQAGIEPLFRDGIVTAAQWSETRQATLEAERNLAEVEAALADIESRQEMAAHGIGFGREMVETGKNGFERELSELRIQKMDLAAEIREIEQQIILDKSYGDTNNAYQLSTPIRGLVWRRQVVEGESLSEGQPVVDVADAQTLFVDAYFGRDFMNSIAIGDRASVYLLAESRFIEGRVVDIQVQERTDRDVNTINTMPLDVSMLRVRIEMPVGKLQAENIGQLAKVLTSGGGGGWAERLLLWLSLVLRSDK